MIPWFTIPPLQLGNLELDVPTCLAFAGAVLAMAFVRWRARREGLSPKVAVDGVFSILVSAFIAGHVIDVLLYRSFALRTNWQVILPWHEGSCSLGAGVGVAVATAIVFRTPSRKLDWRYIDEAALAILLGLAVLRVGCFLGHHHAGKLSTFAFAVSYPGGARHDLGLYEAVFALAIFASILWRMPHRPASCAAGAGLASGCALLAYGVFRFMLEFLRADDIESIGRHSDPRYWTLTVVQYGALVVAAYGAWLLRSVQHARRNAPMRDAGHPGSV